MGAPFSEVSISGYNSNPPPDDGTEVPQNEATWAGIKSKLTDPLNTALSSTQTAITTAFGKVVGGAGVLSTSISYEVTANDQGKLVKATGSGITITTPSATVVGSPFVFAVLNLAGGNITIDGNGSQTIDGASSITLEDTRGCLLFTDGSNWFTAGQNWQFDEPDRPVNLFNGSWAVSVATNTLIIALQNSAGSDPSATASVLTAFRSATVTADAFNVRETTGALSLTVPATATLGFAANEANMIYFGLIDVGDGTVVIGVSKDAAVWNEDRLVSTTAIDTASDSRSVIYTGSAQTSKPCRLLGAVLITTGATAGNWSEAPTRVTGFNFNPLSPYKNTIKLQANWTTVTSSVIRDSFNVSSLTDNATGDTTLTPAVNFPDRNYAVGVMAGNLAGVGDYGTLSPQATPTASALRLLTGIANSGSANSLATSDAAEQSVVVSHF